METEEAIEGFSVFSFLKGKNMQTHSKVERNAQLIQAWRSLSDEEKARYKKIASEFLTPDPPSQSLQSSLFSALTKTLRQVKCRLNSFSKNLKRARTRDPFCPVNLPHEDILTCAICSHGFDQATHCPVCLPCGHTFCGVCIGLMTDRGKMSCPMDRRETQIAGMRVNVQMMETLGRVVEGAMCRKHAAQVVAIDREERELLCGYCLESEDNAVLLDSPEGNALSAQNITKCTNKTNHILQTLHYLYASIHRFTLLTEHLALKLSLPTVKNLLCRIRKLTLALSQCAQELQSLAMSNLQVLSSTACLYPWQQAVLEVPAAPHNFPRFEDLFEQCENWIRSEEQESNLPVSQ